MQSTTTMQHWAWHIDDPKSDIDVVSVGGAHSKEAMMARIGDDLQYYPLYVAEMEGSVDDLPGRYGVMPLVHSEQPATLIDPKRFDFTYLVALHEAGVLHVRVYCDDKRMTSRLGCDNGWDLKRKRDDFVDVWGLVYPSEVESEDQWVSIRTDVRKALKASMAEQIYEWLCRFSGSEKAESTAIEHLHLRPCFDAFAEIAKDVSDKFPEAGVKLEEMRARVECFEENERKFPEAKRQKKQ